jgi:nucleotide-binding universal stress UspA family protein
MAVRLLLDEGMIDLRRILCPVDFSEPSLRALQHASAFAGWYDSVVTALYVNPMMPTEAGRDVATFAVGSTAVLEARSTAVIQELRGFVKRAAGDRTVDIELEDGPGIAEVIVARASSLPADLVVMGTHGRTGIKRLLVGSVAERVLRTAPCPVMVVPLHDVVPPETVSFKHIVCAIDFSDSSLAALRWAVSLAQETDAHLWLLHTIEVPPELRASTVVTDEKIDELNASAWANTLNRLRSLIPPEAAGFCSVETAIASGEAAHAILRFAAEHTTDLIVMGAQGHGAIDRLIFGSKTRDVIGGATCPILTVR